MPIAPPFCALADVETLIGTIDASQHTRVATLCNWASAAVLAYKPTLTALTAIPTPVRIVCAQLVAGVLTAGTARSESIGDYSVTHDTTTASTMQLTDEQRALIDSATSTSSIGRGRRAGTARMRSIVDDDPVIT